ncbi:MAG: hypothetical protein RLZZ126_821 [Pseudomonadota bacterium]
MMSNKTRSAVFVLGSLATAMVLGAGAVQAQNFPITSDQRATAAQVAQAGVPLTELAPNAPDSHTVKSGDTLWGISGLFLKSPWRWPELWGMNMNEVRNPHRIFPGQVLVLERGSDGRARLRMANAGAAGGGADGLQTVRVSPRTRTETLADSILPTLKPSAIEPFLVEPMVVGADGLANAPRLVAAMEGRVLLSRGDRAYARGEGDTQIAMARSGKDNELRVVRNLVPLKDPGTGEVLGYEAQYIGKARVVAPELRTEQKDKDGKLTSAVVTPASVDIIDSKEEMRAGDRLVPEPAREFNSYAPRAPSRPVEARVVSVYGSTVAAVAQNQVVAINKGSKDGMEPGHVLAILHDGETLVDKTSPKRETMKLPNERNGLMMVFRTFDRVSYALILEIATGVRVGDRLVSPR